MHLEQQRKVIAEVDRKASFIFKLLNLPDTLTDQIPEQVDTIFPGPIKCFRKRKAGKY